MEYLVPLLVFCAGTTVASFTASLKNELRIFKDMADLGYKIDLKRMSDAIESVDPNLAKNSRLQFLIPVYNLAMAYKQITLYNENRDMIYDQLRVMDVLIEMTDEEKEEYKKKPTGFNAMILDLKMQIKEAKTIHMTVEIEDSKVVFKVNKNYDIEIISVEGKAKNLTNEEQKEIVRKKLGELKKSVDEKYKSLDDFKEELLKNEVIDLTKKDKKDEEINQENTNYEENLISNESNNTNELKYTDSDLINKEINNKTSKIKKQKRK